MVTTAAKLIPLLTLAYFIHAGNLSPAALPVDAAFKLPAPLPKWPPGGGFAAGEIDLGGLQVRQVSAFRRIWTGYKGGLDDKGASFFEPAPIPAGFSMLAAYGQPNSRQLFGWVLAGKSNAGDESGAILKQPTDYTLAYQSPGDSPAYFWRPAPPPGFKPVGYIVTASPDKPSLDSIRCVRDDFTDEPEIESWIWGPGDGANVYSLRPKTRGENAEGVSVGAFYVTSNSSSDISISCLKNKNSKNSTMLPNLSQIEAMFRTYSPQMYLHPDETFLPSSVNWFFTNGALLYKKGKEFNRSGIDPNGANLPQGGDNDGLYWIDLPQDKDVQDNLKKGNLQSAETYLHVKPVLGRTFTDIQSWMFYPFNGHATAKLQLIKRFPLGKIGQHVGDWEHVTLRISNFDGMLYSVFFGQHSKGQWVDSSHIEFQNGSNKVVGYSALNSHASYYQPGLVLLGGKGFGIRDDTDRSNLVWDTAARFLIVAADGTTAAAPPWLNYNREWGPNQTYEIGDEIEKVKKLLPGKLKSKFVELIGELPSEILREEGPTGPKMKNNWSGDEEELRR
ncbi:hypothetical protein At1g04090-like [Andrographis paniculata]|uniref:hypothetical protein At1g04090-like n=1 Tax=Andrographis paniculata TaxID=175694 RepID=UPI0021E8478B|nr:hypothetical protein At1g04090-like [Andrographis paniculata]